MKVRDAHRRIIRIIEKRERSMSRFIIYCFIACNILFLAGCKKEKEDAASQASPKLIGSRLPEPKIVAKMGKIQKGMFKPVGDNIVLESGYTLLSDKESVELVIPSCTFCPKLSAVCVPQIFPASTYRVEGITIADALVWLGTADSNRSTACSKLITKFWEAAALESSYSVEVCQLIEENRNTPTALLVTKLYFLDENSGKWLPPTLD